MVSLLVGRTLLSLRIGAHSLITTRTPSPTHYKKSPITEPMLTTYQEAIHHWQTQLRNIERRIQEDQRNPTKAMTLVQEAITIRRAMVLEHAYYAPSYVNTAT